MDWRHVQEELVKTSGVDSPVFLMGAGASLSSGAPHSKAVVKELARQVAVKQRETVTRASAAEQWGRQAQRAIKGQITHNFDDLIEIGNVLTWRHWVDQWQRRPDARSAVLHSAAADLCDADGTFWTPRRLAADESDLEVQQGLSALFQAQAKGRRSEQVVNAAHQVAVQTTLYVLQMGAAGHAPVAPAVRPRACEGRARAPSRGAQRSGRGGGRGDRGGGRGGGDSGGGDGDPGGGDGSGDGSRSRRILLFCAVVSTLVGVFGLLGLGGSQSRTTPVDVNVFLECPSVRVPGKVAILNHMVQYQPIDRTLAALADPTRRGVLERLGRQGVASVSELAEPAGISLTGMKKHLRVLEEAELVSTEKVGRTRRCRLGPKRLEDLQAWMDSYRAMLEERFDRLEELLERTKGDSQ